MRDHALVQLTLARMREFYREPEAIFWVFGFPIVLAFALGIAFRNRGPGELRVAVLRQGSDSALAAALGHAPGLTVTLGIAFRNRGPGELRVAVLRQGSDSAL